MPCPKVMAEFRKLVDAKRNDLLADNEMLWALVDDGACAINTGNMGCGTFSKRVSEAFPGQDISDALRREALGVLKECFQEAKLRIGVVSDDRMLPETQADLAPDLAGRFAKYFPPAGYEDNHTQLVV